jgi:hypothetical protein
LGEFSVRALQTIQAIVRVGTSQFQLREQRRIFFSSDCLLYGHQLAIRIINSRAFSLFVMLAFG